MTSKKYEEPKNIKIECEELSSINIVINPVLPPNFGAIVQECPNGKVGCERCAGIVQGKHIVLFKFEQNK